MAAEVGESLEEEALKRKERLLAMRQKSASASKQEQEVSLTNTWTEKSFGSNKKIVLFRKGKCSNMLITFKSTDHAVTFPELITKNHGRIF